MLPARLDQALHHRALLVDLDGEDREVGLGVVELAGGVAERVRQLVDLPLQELREPEQERRLVAAAGEVLDDLEDVDGPAGVARRGDQQVAVLADGEIAVPPAVEAVDLDGVLDREAVRRRHVHPFS